MSGFSFSLFGRRKALKMATDRAYAGLMGTALAPKFYADETIADTFEARAQMVTLYAAVALRRLRMAAKPDETDPLSEALNARILDGFDAAYREKGVGDSSIARKVRKLAEAHYGLGKAVTESLVAHDLEAVCQVLVRNGVTNEDKVRPFAGHLLNMLARFENQPEEQVRLGNFAWDA
ncbi:MAG: ubiquinol-cytochrome C chaperone family protein [Hyphomonas sp.]